jgi:hypothetical protein
MQERENADQVFRAETCDQGRAHQAGGRTGGRTVRAASPRIITKDADNWWTEAIKKQNESLATPEQRRLFTQRAEPLRQSTIASTACGEVGVDPAREVAR